MLISVSDIGVGLPPLQADRYSVRSLQKLTAYALLRLSVVCLSLSLFREKTAATGRRSISGHAVDTRAVKFC